MTTEIKLPISKLSYSSLTQLLRNPIIFKLKEILGVYDVKMSVSGTIGKAVHEALKFYYGGNKDVPCPADLNEARPMAKEVGLKWLETQPDHIIKYGKTGNREEMLKGFTQAMDFYFSDEPVYKDILMVEEKIEANIKSYTGDDMPLPIVCIPDLIVRDGTTDAVDIKVVRSFTEYENEDGEPHEDYIKIVQAKFIDRAVKAARGIKLDRMIFRELKRSKNKDGSRQIRDYVVPLNHEPYDIIFDNLFRDVYKFLSSDPVFLPNLSDPFDGEHAGLIYAQGLINADMSDVEVVHKVRDVAYTTKKFLTSRLDSEINRNLLPAEKVKMKMAEFGIPIEPAETTEGASVTQYRFKVSAGVRMSTIKKHHADIVKALEVKGDVRILAPIPGTSLLGIEVENAERKAVKLDMQNLGSLSPLTIPIGVDVDGAVVKVPLHAMPHLLVAGTTGSGKSTFLHATLTALTKTMDPADMKLVLIDPKRVELSPFKKCPHLMHKVLYEYADVVESLTHLVGEMERRYSLLEDSGKREIDEYNFSRRNPENRLPFIVVVIDEFADFMIRSKIERKRGKKKIYIDPKQGGKLKKLQAAMKEDEDPADVELLIVRLAQMARAVGIHLIIATQRPSADVISGLIRANFPTRIAFSTASAVESGVIGIPGAEKLAGRGDLLFSYPQNRGVVRLQGFIHKR